MDKGFVRLTQETFGMNSFQFDQWLNELSEEELSGVVETSQFIFTQSEKIKSRRNHDAIQAALDRFCEEQLK